MTDNFDNEARTLAAYCIEPPDAACRAAVMAAAERAFCEPGDALKQRVLDAAADAWQEAPPRRDWILPIVALAASLVLAGLIVVGANRHGRTMVATTSSPPARTVAVAADWDAANPAYRALAASASRQVNGDRLFIRMHQLEQLLEGDFS